MYDVSSGLFCRFANKTEAASKSLLSEVKCVWCIFVHLVFYSSGCSFFTSFCLYVSYSLDLSLLSPDSSYVCYPSVDGGDPCSCRRSPRLLTNGYYTVTEDSFSWDEDGNVSLAPCKTKVSYKENMVRWETQDQMFYLGSVCFHI